MSNNIEITGNDYNNFKGKLSSAMINASSDDFTIIFQEKDAFEKVDDTDSVGLELNDELNLPLLIMSYEELIHSAGPNCRILFNGVINIETILTGYVIGKIFRKENIKHLQNLFNDKLDDIINNKNLIEELNPLMIEAKDADDFDFSNLEDEMYNIINNFLNELLN